MTQAASTLCANALNTRIGRNHKSWFQSSSAKQGSCAHWIANAASAASEQTPQIGLMSLRKASTSQLRRGWADQAIATAAKAAGCQAAAESAFGIANRMLGLGRRSERLGKLGSEPAKAPAADSIGRLLAMAEFDNSDQAQAIFVQMAREALAAKGSTHLCIHSGYGQRNGYRGSHVLIDLSELASGSLVARSHSEGGKGAAVHVSAHFGGESIDLVSFKRKGGDGPSEKYGDQLQATLLARGALRAADALPGTAKIHDTGRAVHESLPATLIN